PNVGGRADDGRDAQLFDGCEVVVSGSVVSQPIAPAPIEPRAAAAVPEPDGGLTIWISTQAPHLNRDRVAAALGLDASNVRVLTGDVGGGVGGKTRLPEVALGA